jgi:hypothetical protein
VTTFALVTVFDRARCKYRCIRHCRQASLLCSVSLSFSSFLLKAGIAQYFNVVFLSVFASPVIIFKQLANFYEKRLTLAVTRFFKFSS